MVHLSLIEARLSQLGVRSSRWFKPEIKELQHILMDHEKMIAFVTGRYFGGFAVLIATDQRLLLIDKKVLFLTVEDIRYDMVSEIEYNSRMLDASVIIYTFNKQHKFTTVRNKHLLRKLTSYTQQRVMEIRQYQHQQQAPSSPSEIAYHQPQPQVHVQHQPQYSSPAPAVHVATQPMYVQHSQTAPAVASFPEPQAVPHISSTPSMDVPQVVGATAMQASNSWRTINPYTKGSFSMRRMGSSVK